jgi:hypothetical protein
VPRSPNRPSLRARRNVRLAALLGGLLTLVGVALAPGWVGGATTSAVLACGDHTGLTTSTVVCPTPVPPTPTGGLQQLPTATPSPVPPPPPTVEATITLVITRTSTPVAATATPTAAPCVCPTEVPPTATTAPPPPPPTIAPPTATATEQPCVCVTATPVPPTATTAPPPPPPTIAPPTATATEQPCVCPTATPVPPTATATTAPPPPPPPPPTVVPPTATTVPVFEGCTPGYWKQDQHFDSWTGYGQSATLESVFDVPNSLNRDNQTLIDALQGGGGSGVQGAATILLRASVAALLNSSSPGVDYTLTTAQVIAQVNTALASNNRETMLTLATTLDQYNNRGCDLN